MRSVTEQENFWAGEFGDEYSRRNRGDNVLAAKVAMFARILARAGSVGSVRELGANIGLNMKALRLLLPDARLQAIELNETAYRELAAIPTVESRHGSILDASDLAPVDLTFTAGVMIHINPEELHRVYEHLFEATRRYVLVIEYYNPSPVTVSYRGNADRLFKRDFAGEMMKAHPLRLVDYGFIYHGDPVFPGDDLTWFLMEKAG